MGDQIRNLRPELLHLYVERGHSGLWKEFDRAWYTSCQLYENPQPSLPLPYPTTYVPELSTYNQQPPRYELLGYCVSNQSGV